MRGTSLKFSPRKHVFDHLDHLRILFSLASFHLDSNAFIEVTFHKILSIAK